jgi:hypothetical protein
MNQKPYNNISCAIPSDQVPKDAQRFFSHDYMTAFTYDLEGDFVPYIVKGDRLLRRLDNGNFISSEYSGPVTFKISYGDYNVASIGWATFMIDVIDGRVIHGPVLIEDIQPVLQNEVDPTLPENWSLYTLRVMTKVEEVKEQINNLVRVQQFLFKGLCEEIDSDGYQDLSEALREALLSYIQAEDEESRANLVKLIKLL